MAGVPQRCSVIIDFTFDFLPVIESWEDVFQLVHLVSVSEIPDFMGSYSVIAEVNNKKNSSNKKRFENF